LAASDDKRSLHWRLLTAAGAVCGWSVGTALVVRAAVAAPGAPYNLRELVGEIGIVALVALSAALCLIGLLPAVIARWSLRRAVRLVATPVLLMLAALGVAALVVAAAPTESVHDVVGYPTLDGNHALESIGRLGGLLLGPMAALALGFGWAVGTAAAAGAGRLRGVVWMLVPSAVCGVVSRTVVVAWAGTDNLTELIARGGGLPAEAYLAAMLVVLGFNVAAIAWLLRRPRLNDWPAWVCVLVATAASMLLAYALFRAGTVQSLWKYGTRFSAAQFLLGASREAKLSQVELVARWSVVYVGAVAALGVGGAIGLMGLRSGGSREAAPGDSPDRPPAVLLLLIAVVLQALVVYGAVVPLSFESMPSAEAMERFADDLRRSSLYPLTRTDFSTNLLLGIALGYLWAVAFAGAARSRGAHLLAGMSACVVVASAAALQEFLQVYVPRRTPNMHDIGAQGLGGLLGFMLFTAIGPALVRPLGPIVRPNRTGVWRAVLALYLIGYVIYALMPLELIVSFAELRAKFSGGQMILVPFVRDWPPLHRAVWELGTDFALCVPIGLLLAATSGAGGRWQRSLTAAAVLLGGIELVQLLLVQRVTDTTDIVVGLAGVATGLWLSGAPAAWVQRHPRRAFVTGAVAYTLLLVAVQMAPFDFESGRVSWSAAKEQLFRAPATMLYFTSPFNALDVLLRQLLMGVRWGFLWAGALRVLGGRRLMFAGTLLLLSFVAFYTAIELVQLGLPARTTDPTGIVLGVIGATAGMTLAALRLRMQ